MIQMTTQTTTETQAPATPKAPKALSYATLGGAVLSFASTFLAWTWTAEFPGNLTVDGYPGGLQLLTLTGALLTAVLVLGGLGIPGLRWATPGGKYASVRLMALATFATTWFTVIAIAVELGGLVNLEPGAWLAAVATALTVALSFALPARPNQPEPAAGPRSPPSSRPRPPQPPRNSPAGPRSSSSPSPSASACWPSPTASARKAPRTSSASSSSSASASPPSTSPASAAASPASPSSTRT